MSENVVNGNNAKNARKHEPYRIIRRWILGMIMKIQYGLPGLMWTECVYCLYWRGLLLGLWVGAGIGAVLALLIGH